MVREYNIKIFVVEYNHNMEYLVVSEYNIKILAR